MNALTLTFEEVVFDVVDRDGQCWLRLPQIGVALGYENPHKIQQVYQRNIAEFTDDMTAIIRLHTAGGVQDVRVFSLRGAHLLGMLARTDKAQDFRRWVLDVLDNLNKPPVIDDPDSFERSEQLVSAARVYNAFLRVGRQLRLGQSRAAVAANAVALRHTGIDVLREMAVQPDELLAAAELTVAGGEADQLAQRVKAWLESSPVADVTCEEIVAGVFGIAPGDPDYRSAVVRAGIAMSRLGWQRRERRGDYHRRYVYQRPG